MTTAAKPRWVGFGNHVINPLADIVMPAGKVGSVSLAVQIKRRVVRPVRVRHDHRNTDVYVVSYPKSGRTWLRVMLGKAISDRYGLPQDQLLHCLAAQIWRLFRAVHG